MPVAKASTLLGGMKDAHPKWKVMQRNVDQCLLFSRLAPEDRNRIYYFVIGGRKIHVHAGGPRMQCKFCISPRSKDENGKDHLSPIEAAEEAFAHGDCGRRAPAIHLWFLEACHQIYGEAALLVFTMNTFQSDNHMALAKFSQRPNSPQRQAVTHLELDTFSLLHHWREPGSKTTSKQLSWLTRLKTIAITVMLQGGLRGLEPNIEGLDRFLQRLTGFFQIHAVEAVTVRFSRVGSAHKKRGALKAVPQDYIEWACRAEKVLLDKWEKKADVGGGEDVEMTS